jgi:alkylation response protein AidB-like acyl-CoA dehydrogenase
VRFHPSEEQEQICASLLRILTDVSTPERRRQLIEGPSDHDDLAWRAMADAGLHGLVIPDAYGGSGMRLLDAALACEVIGQEAPCGAYMSQMLAGFAIAQSVDEAAKAKFLPALAAGELCGTIAFSDGWVPQTWTATVRDSHLAGHARFVPGADCAGVFVVGVAGGALALVESGPAVEVVALQGSDFTRRLWSVTFHDTPCVLLEGSAGQTLFDAALLLVAADALGGGQRCLDLSVDYAKIRRQFDVPIGQFQAVKHQLADMALLVEPARALLWYAGYAQDAGIDEASRIAALLKAHLTEAFCTIARSAVQIHGGVGYAWEFDLQLWFRRSLYDYAFLGAPALQHERAASLAGW